MGQIKDCKVSTKSNFRRSEKDFLGEDCGGGGDLGGKKQCKPQDKGLMASRWPWWSTTVMTTTAANLFILDPPSDTERANNARLCTTYLAHVSNTAQLNSLQEVSMLEVRPGQVKCQVSDLGLSPFN